MLEKCSRDQVRAGFGDLVFSFIRVSGLLVGVGRRLVAWRRLNERVVSVPFAMDFLSVLDFLPFDRLFSVLEFLCIYVLCCVALRNWSSTVPVLFICVI